MKLLIALTLILVAVVAYYGSSMYQKYQIAEGLVEKATVYHQPTQENGVRVLVLGDSTAVGVGAEDSVDSVAAQLGREVSAVSVENYAVSGAVVGDLYGQLEKANFETYDYILVQIGGNNIIRFNDVQKNTKEFEAVLQELPTAGRLLVMPPGNVGATTFFPFFLNPFYTSRTLELHAEFTAAVKDFGGTYINLYSPPETDPFVQNPETYLSPDGLHPSSAGYAEWFRNLKESL